ncbi:hypothetical protein [Rhodobacter capsulatus]|jgi:hypothetical protein|uniref:Membrane-associated oxidoreductase n=1 Tax=Rhodobacter capsulatus (strain ATCC BAA-309 / NBRC 16581 / SB1003) TaxID=272942 RepID=D5AR62_RHOCB|nr:hypothetical protein [Rhodobacter capsulatus]ADE86867.1 conserved hypothetical protein [Rhodobacter capsulatus SB 1003]ETD00572.1 hypothetical protein U714_17160 [Rhodobacter capsulatus DE442]ETD74913.1 hypothetical protein U717_17125 [Rhodobacter capsulatus R121]ETE52425.1 hypothetical protein U715_17115 [Rhodobacter capsulatus Y262]MDS0928667.1 hypothetical protein [Rhodobacter capsulatus]
MADGDLSEAFAWAEERLRRELWPREKQFIATGGYAWPDGFKHSNRERPKTDDDSNRFDARLIRWLLTQEIPGIVCRPEGVTVMGLWIEETLSLGFVDCERAINASNCTFQEAPVLRNAQLNGLYLTGTALPGFNAVRLTCNGPIHLDTGFTANACVQLGGSRITGHVYCRGGHFASKKGPALNLSSAEIGADVFLNDGFTAHGAVKLVRVQIVGQLTCDDGKFEATDGLSLNCNAAVIGADVFLRNKFNATGRVDFARAQVTGNLRCQSAHFNGAFNAEGAKIEGGFFWENVSGKVVVLDLTETSVERLNDDSGSWAKVKTPKLSGFRFDSIQSDMTVQDRLNLLGRKSERTISCPFQMTRRRNDFDPQPYSQLAKVYDAMGHRRDAAKVRYARDERLMWATFFRALAPPKPDTFGQGLAFVSLVWGCGYRVTFGYGHAPFKALRTALLILAATVWLANATYQRGEMAPANVDILLSDDWKDAIKNGCPSIQTASCTMPLRLWENTPAGQDYEAFSPCIYALDLFLPLGTLAQKDSWAPSKDRGAFGWTLHYCRWIIQLSGWLLIATAAAVFSGVLGKKD